MHPILHIFLYNIVPILLMILAGYTLGHFVDMHLPTLTKINFYLFVPAFTFTYLYTAEIGLEKRLTLLAAFLILVVNFLLGLVVSKALHFEAGLGEAFQNSLMFYNSGNVGVPLISLIYSTGFFASTGDDSLLTLALTAQVMVLVVQNLSTNTLGFYNASRGQGKSIKEAIVKVLKMPTIYTIALAIILRFIPQLDLTTTPVWPVLEYLRNALVAVALMTLGVQLSKTNIKSIEWRVILAALLRLLGGPLVALGIIKILNLSGVTAQVLFISSSVPTAVNTALLAAECKNHPDFAAQVVLVTTLACPLTLIPVIYLAPQLFPLTLGV